MTKFVFVIFMAASLLPSASFAKKKKAPVKSTAIIKSADRVKTIQAAVEPKQKNQPAIEPIRVGASKQSRDIASDPNSKLPPIFQDSVVEDPAANQKKPAAVKPAKK